MNWEMVERLGGWAVVLIILGWMMRNSDARHHDDKDHLAKLMAQIGKKLSEEVEAHKMIITVLNTMVGSQAQLVLQIERLAGKIDDRRK